MNEGEILDFTKATVITSSTNTRDINRAIASTDVRKPLLAPVACPPLYTDDVSYCNILGIFNIQGASVGTLDDLDSVITTYMIANCIPNGAFTVVSSDGRLVYCKAFTYCSLLRAHGEEIFVADVHSRFRVASVSKVLTALGIMAAVEDAVFGPPGIDAFAIDYTNFMVTNWRPPWQTVLMHSELANIQLKHLLTHSAGWVEDAVNFKPYNPTSTLLASKYYPGILPEKNDVAIAETSGSTPVSKGAIEQYVNRLPLNWDPAKSTYWSYSNHGFVVLADIIEHATGISYESYLKWRILDRLGASDSCLGDTERSKRKAREVKYYSSRFPDEGGDRTQDIMAYTLFGAPLPTGEAPYAYYNLRNGDGASAWVCSAYDIALILREVFCAGGMALTSASIDQVLTTSIPRSANGKQYLGFGDAQVVTGDYSKAGGLEGTQAYVYSYGTTTADSRSGVSWGYMFNRNYGGIGTAINGSVHGALSGIKDWGLATDNLFGAL